MITRKLQFARSGIMYHLIASGDCDILCVQKVSTGALQLHTGDLKQNDPMVSQTNSNKYAKGIKRYPKSKKVIVIQKKATSTKIFFFYEMTFLLAYFRFTRHKCS